jgi:hypothetical protein
MIKYNNNHDTPIHCAPPILLYCATHPFSPTVSSPPITYLVCRLLLCRVARALCWDNVLAGCGGGGARGLQELNLVRITSE